MNKLLHAELRRRLISVIYIIEIIIILIYNFLEIACQTYGFEVDIPYFLFNKTPLICICIAVNVSLNISWEFDNRTINNKLFCGYNKAIFYKVEIGIGILEAVGLFIIDTISVVIFGTIRGYDADISLVNVFVNLIISIIIISTVSVISTILVILINYRILSIFIVIGLTLLLLYCGKITVHTLNQPEETSLFSIDGTVMDNPLYVEGAKRTAYNIHLFVSPYAQSCYVSYMLHENETDKYNNSLIFKAQPYHFDFIINDLLECLFLYFLGFYLFNKRNLQ